MKRSTSYLAWRKTTSSADPSFSSNQSNSNDLNELLVAWWQSILEDEKSAPGIVLSSSRSSLRRHYEVAQRIAERARSATGSLRVELAKEALGVSAYCVEAYILLAEEAAKSAEQMVLLYRLGAQAGERAIGPDLFEEYTGHLWDLEEARVYMKSRFKLSLVLWQTGEVEEATDHLIDLILLNSKDDQRASELLVNCLLEQGITGEASRLIDQFSDSKFANWRYAEALCLYMTDGPSRRALESLSVAVSCNSSVPAEILRKSGSAVVLPPFFSVGDEMEALVYASRAKRAWESVEGAMEWLADFVQSQVNRCELH